MYHRYFVGEREIPATVIRFNRLQMKDRKIKVKGVPFSKRLNMLCATCAKAGYPCNPNTGQTLPGYQVELVRREGKYYLVSSRKQ